MKNAHIVAIALVVSCVTARIAHSQQKPACIDPATPLRTLVANYDRWLPLPPSIRSGKARVLLGQYLRTGDDTDYHKALRSYETLEADFPSNLGLTLTLGLLYTTGPDLNYRGGDGYRHVPVFNFSNADARGARNLEKVLRADSTQWIAAIAMTRVALVSIEHDRIAQAQSLIKRALSADPQSVPLNLAWSDLLNREERFGDALRHIEAHDSGCAVQAAARAEALMLTGDTAAGSRLYLNTLEKARPSELDRYYDDVRVMMTVAYNKTYRAVPEGQRPAWLRAWWERTAAASGRTVETRVAEQTVRAAYADNHYRSVYTPIDADVQPLAVLSDTSHIVPWNAPGIFFVRHGPPDYRYHTDEGASELEAWVYVNMQPPVIVLLAHRKFPPTNWMPLYVPPCTSAFLGRWNAGQADERLANGDDLSIRDIYYALSAFDRRFGDLGKECPLVAMGMTRIKYDQLVVQYRYDNRKILPRLGHTESALPHYTKPVRIAAAAYEFRTADRNPEVVAISWIPVADLHDSTSDPAQRLRITYSVTDTMIASFRTDTVVALPPGARSGQVRVPVTWRNPSISDGTLRVTVTDPQDTLRGATKAVAFKLHGDRSAVALSDIVLADIDAQGPLVRGNLRLSPLPNHEVRPGDAFRVFFELYGVHENDVINTTIHIYRTDQKTILEQLRLAGKRQERTITFDDRVTLDGRGVAMRDVDVAGDLVPGRYSLDVTVRTTGGVIAKRSGVFTVEQAK